MDTVGVQGTVTAAAGAAALGARAALPDQVSVSLVNGQGATAATDVVTAADPAFALNVPSGSDYVMVFRDKQTGRTLGVLEATATAGAGFSLPVGAPDVNLGTVTVDPKKGKATCDSADSLNEPEDEVEIESDGDKDGVPDVADHDSDEDDDGTPDSSDDLDFDDSESVDSDHDGVGNHADTDDDHDGIPDISDSDADGDGIDDSIDPDDDNDGIPDSQEPPSDTVTVQGAVEPLIVAVGLRARAAALPDHVSVALVDEQGVTGATEVITPAVDPTFALEVPAGYDYVMVFRDALSGRTLGVLEATATPGPAFSLPAGTPDVTLGTVSVDPTTGTATCPDADSLEEPEDEVEIESDDDSDGVPNVADHDSDEDDDGTPDSSDDLDFDDSEHVDTDHDGIGNNADSDDDGDDVDDSVDTDDDGDGIDDSVDPDDDNDGTPDDEENPAP